MRCVAGYAKTIGVKVRLLRKLWTIEPDHAVEASVFGGYETRGNDTSGWAGDINHRGFSRFSLFRLVAKNLSGVRRQMDATFMVVPETYRSARRVVRKVSQRQNCFTLFRHPPRRLKFVGMGFILDGKELIDIAAAIYADESELRPHLAIESVVTQREAAPIPLVTMAFRQ